ncbi:MAG: RAMP superfamily CRISPR-associated protein [Gammaproteobacteria bacterium]
MSPTNGASSSRTLNIDIRTYWHAGTGRGQGVVLDAVCHRDRDGLPELAGRHIRGLVREAVESAEALGMYGNSSTQNITQTLFGSRSDGTLESISGVLRFSNGVLPLADREALLTNPHLIDRLFDKLFSTAINSQTGAALSHSLRGIEVVIPVKLECRIQTIPGVSDVPDQWSKMLKEALPFVRAVGASRNRGLGRAELTLGAAA